MSVYPHQAPQIDPFLVRQPVSWVKTSFSRYCWYESSKPWPLAPFLNFQGWVGILQLMSTFSALMATHSSLGMSQSVTFAYVMCQAQLHTSMCLLLFQVSISVPFLSVMCWFDVLSEKTHSLLIYF